MTVSDHRISTTEMKLVLVSHPTFAERLRSWGPNRTARRSRKRGTAGRRTFVPAVEQDGSVAGLGFQQPGE
jgi:hypothetical protein